MAFDASNVPYAADSGTPGYIDAMATLPQILAVWRTIPGAPKVVAAAPLTSDAQVQDPAQREVPAVKF